MIQLELEDIKEVETFLPHNVLKIINERLAKKLRLICQTHQPVAHEWHHKCMICGQRLRPIAFEVWHDEP